MPSRHNVAVAQVVLALLMAVLGACQAGPSAAMKEVLGAKVDAEWAAFKSKDAKAYGELLAEDFVAVEVDGEGTRTRDQAMREVGRTGVSDAALSRLEVRPLGGDAAMVTYEASMTFTPHAPVHFLRVYVTEIRLRRDGDWKAVQYQETRVR